jgi:hypothetical protein
MLTYVKRRWGLAGKGGSLAVLLAEKERKEYVVLSSLVGHSAILFS